MTRRHAHDDFDTPHRAPSMAEQLRDTLFDAPESHQPELHLPVIRTPAPSVSSGSSPDAADRLSAHARDSQNDTILKTLATLSPGLTLSRHEISERTGIEVSTLCLRIKGDLSPTYVECVGKARPSHKKPTLFVNGYRLTEQGRKRVSVRAA